MTNPEAFIFPIRLEGKINENVLADTGSDINTMPYQIYEQLGRKEIKKVDRGITVINHDLGRMHGNSYEVPFVRLWEETMLKPDHLEPNALDNMKQWNRYCFHKFIMSSYYRRVATMRRSLVNGMGCDGEIDDTLRIKLREAESNEEIFTYVAWIRAFNIKEPIYPELCHEFYLTCEFDEVCVDDELQTKKIIKFRLGGRAHNLTLLEFALRLGFYHADELEEDRFDVYFQGGLHNDDHFNTQEYWLSISREENLGYDPYVGLLTIVVANNSQFAITIPKTANEFAIKEVLNAAAGGIFLYKTPNQAYQLLEDKVLLKLDWAKNQKTKSSLKKTVAFADEGSSNSNTDKIMARMDAMTLKMDAQYKELQTHAKKTKPDLDEDNIPMSREEEAKFMQTFRKTRFYNDYRDRDSNRDNWRSNERSSYNRDNYRSNTDDKPYDLQKQFNDFMKSQQSTNAFVKETFMDLKTQLETVAKNHQASIQNLETKFDRLADKQSGRPSGSLPSNTQPNPKGHNSKAYQPPQSRNEHVNAVFTRSGKSYNPPVNPNDQQNDSETPINFDSDDEDDEPTPQPKPQNPKSVKETLLPKPYKLKISYPQRLRKEKMEAQYGKFLDMIRAVRINVTLIDVLAGMPNYGKFL
ncbi:hypothetical protein Tco_1213295 [Tanacetum coccineum]